MGEAAVSADRADVLHTVGQTSTMDWVATKQNCTEWFYWHHSQLVFMETQNNLLMYNKLNGTAWSRSCLLMESFDLGKLLSCDKGCWTSFAQQCVSGRTWLILTHTRIGSMLWVDTVFISGFCPSSQQPAAGVAYTHPTTVASYTVHQAPVAAHTVAAAYAPTAATVAVARPAPVAVAAAATAAAYGGYQPTHTAADYGYPQRQPEVPPPPPPVTSQNYQVQIRCLYTTCSSEN